MLYRTATSLNGFIADKDTRANSRSRSAEECAGRQCELACIGPGVVPKGGAHRVPAGTARQPARGPSRSEWSY